MFMNRSKPEQWQTVKSKTEEKKKRAEDKKKTKETRDRLGVVVDGNAAFAAFDRSFVDKEEAAKQQQNKGYKGAFANLEVEAPPQQLQEDSDSNSDVDVPAPAANGVVNGIVKLKQPKAPKKPKLSVGQVAAGLDVPGLQSWMAEVQEHYSANDEAQLEALSGRLTTSFKEASFDLAKLINSKGLDAASQLPYSELPNQLTNALASFVASASEPAVVQLLVPLITAAVAEASGAGAGQGPPGKGKAGLFVALAAILRTRPQALVHVAPTLRMAGRQLSGTGKLPLLLWVINQAALADTAAGVAVWVRLLMPQVLGIAELPGPAGAHKSSKAAAAAIASGIAVDQAQLLVPLDVSLQATAVDYLSGLLDKLGVGAGGAARSGGDITRGDGSLEPTVPGAAVELLSRLVAGKAWAPAAPAAGGAAAANGVVGESKKATAARSAAANNFAPLLPGLTALAAISSCSGQYEDWMLMALESASLSAEAPDAPDTLVLRSASNIVACLCGSDGCFSLWESKHKGGLRGSARILAALQHQPKLLGPLLQQRSSVEAFKGLLAALPSRHRTFLATGKGWQGACARVAEDACSKLPKKLGRGSWGSKASSGGRSVGPVMALLGVGSLLTGVVVMAGLYRKEVAGIVAAYAGDDAARQLDQGLLVPLESAVQQGLTAAEPYVQQAQEAAGPVVAAAWEKAGPLVQQAQERLAPVLVEAERLYGYLSEQLQEIVAKAKQP